MSTLLRWALALIAGIVGRYLAGYFAGSCPASPSDWLCVHWENVAGIASTILAALGYGTVRKAAARVAGRPTLVVVPPPVEYPDASPPMEVPPSPSMPASDAPDPLGDYDPHQGP